MYRTVVQDYHVRENEFFEEIYEEAKELDYLFQRHIYAINDDDRWIGITEAVCTAINEQVNPDASNLNNDIMLYSNLTYAFLMAYYCNRLVDGHDDALEILTSSITSHYEAIDYGIHLTHGIPEEALADYTLTKIGELIVEGWERLLDRLPHINDDVTGVTYAPKSGTISIYHY